VVWAALLIALISLSRLFDAEGNSRYSRTMAPAFYPHLPPDREQREGSEQVLAITAISVGPNFIPAATGISVRFVTLVGDSDCVLEFDKTSPRMFHGRLN
jgi:hypothetical protein